MYFYQTFFFKRILFILLSCLLLFSCGRLDKIITPGDAAPDKQVDVSTIPNAVPKNEPKSRYGNPESYVVFGKRYYVLDSSKNYVEKGIASWYGTKFHGRRTSSGETYDMYAMTAAHKTLPLPTYVQVKNLNNGKYIIVNDYKNATQNYNSKHASILPRMWSPEHAENYLSYSGFLNFKVK